MFRSAPFTFLAMATVAGCNTDISSNYNPENDNYEVLCAPTGRAMFNTGVYIGPDGCLDVTLHIIDEEDPTYWLLLVSWPMYGDYYPLTIDNLTTGDRYNDYIYFRDPELTLYAGDYLLGGFEVVEGLNEFEYTLGGFEDDGEGDAVGEGQFTLHVSLSGL